jgi:hypothetical protein
MNVRGLYMYPYSTTLMGVVKGVLDYYGTVVTDAAAFGGTGHAFFMNIHEGLCPSAPYCWEPSGFRRLLRNFGVVMEDLGFFSAAGSAAERSALEEALRNRMDRGDPCSMVNMDHQLLSGYDDKGFSCLIPWPGCPDYPSRRLSYGSWEELGMEIHASFFAFSRCEPRPESVLTEGLAAGLDMYANPSKYSGGPYRSGLGALENWIAAVEAGRFHIHGNWWCAGVWSECRRMASSWISENICAFDADRFDAAMRLSEVYSAVSVKLLRAGRKTLDSPARLVVLREVRALEEEAASLLETLV